MHTRGQADNGGGFWEHCSNYDDKWQLTKCVEDWITAEHMLKNAAKQSQNASQVMSLLPNASVFF